MKWKSISEGLPQAVDKNMAAVLGLTDKGRIIKVYYFPDRFKTVEWEDWDDYKPEEFPYTESDENAGVVWLKAGWYEDIDCEQCEGYWSKPKNITHWMPLPPKPGDESPSSDPAEVLQLRQWKKEAMELLNPIMEYGQNHPDCKLGSSVTEFVLNKAKAAEVLVKALEKVLNPDYTQWQKQWAAENALKQYEQLKQQ